MGCNQSAEPSSELSKAIDEDVSKEPAHNKVRQQFNIQPEDAKFEKEELDDFELKNIPKDEVASGLLNTTLNSHLLFSSLDSDTISKIVGAMELVEVQAGDVLIAQGDTGDGAMCE